MRQTQTQNGIMEWLDRSVEEVNSNPYPRSWVEREAQKAPQILLPGGLGNPLRTGHPLLLEALHRAGKGLSRGLEYGQEGGMRQTKEAAIRFSRDVDGVELTLEQILVAESGSCPLLGWLAEGMLGQKQYLDRQGMLNALVEIPAYGRHLTVLDQRGVSVRQVDLHDEEGNDMSFVEMLEHQLFKHRVRLVVLSSVHNPTTRVKTPAEIAAAVSLTQEYGAVLFLDDAYRHVYRRRLCPIQSVLTIPEAMNGKVVATLTASKALQSPTSGGFLFGNAELIALATAIRNKKGEGGNIVTQLALGAAMLDYDYLEDTRAAYDEFAADLVCHFNRNGWTEFTESDASIFISARIPQKLLDLGWTSTDFVRALAPLGVVMYPNSFFPGWDKEWVRVCMRGERKLIPAAAEVVGELISHPPSLQ